LYCRSTLYLSVLLSYLTNKRVHYSETIASPLQWCSNVKKVKRSVQPCNIEYTLYEANLITR